MKELNENLKHKLHQSHAGLATLSWSAIYDDEYELLDDLMRVECDPHTVPANKLPRGYAYMRSYQMYYRKNNQLTDKQMTQLKRLASSIAFVLYCQ